MQRPFSATRRPRAGQALEVVAALGGGPQDLLRQHGGAGAPPALGVEAALHRHVVGDQHALHLEALAPQQIRRHVEIHHVAGVVLHNHQDPRAPVNGLGRLIHLVRGGGGEHRAGTGGVQHPVADEAHVHRLVAAAAAGDHRHLPRSGRVRPVDEVRIEVHLDQIRMGLEHPLQRLRDYIHRIIDQLLHRNLLIYREIRVEKGDEPSSTHRCRLTAPGRRRRGRRSGRPRWGRPPAPRHSPSRNRPCPGWGAPRGRSAARGRGPG
jgi:hypothetical protein